MRISAYVPTYRKTEAIRSWVLVFCVSALVLAFLVSMPGSASAQNVRKLDKRLDAVEKQLRAVQRKVFDGVNPRLFPQDGEANIRVDDTTPPSQSGEGGNLTLELLERVTALETRLQSINRQWEELSFQQRQATQALEQFRADVEFRLERLEAAAGLSLVAEGPTGPADGALSDPSASSEDAFAQGSDTEDVANPAGFGDGRPVDPPAGQADALVPDALVPDASAPELAPGELPVGRAQDQYKYAFSFVRRGDYAGAKDAFRAFLDRHSESELASGAHYWLGRSYFIEGQFADAADAFLTGYEGFPQGDKAAENLAFLGISLIELEAPEEACAAFDTFDSQYGNAASSLKERVDDARKQADCSG
ncbi:MAG: tol-pal system protein YbgF [Pseudomonadota bacterium]